MKFISLDLLESLSHSKGYIRTQKLEDNLVKIIPRVTTIRLWYGKHILFICHPDKIRYLNGEVGIYLNQMNFTSIWETTSKIFILSNLRLILYYPKGEYSFSNCDRIVPIETHFCKNFGMNFGNKSVFFIES